MYVYMFKVQKFFKIGSTWRVANRIGAFQCYSPFDLQVLLVTTVRATKPSLESRLKKYFAPHRLRGEWFRWHPRVLQQARKVIELARLERKRQKRRRSTMSEDAGDAPVQDSGGLAAKMTAARKERNMTQGQLADRLKIKQASLSMIETGELEISAELGKRIRGWMSSGSGPQAPSPRGPYKTGKHLRTMSEGETKVRSTLPAEPGKPPPRG